MFNIYLHQKLFLVLLRTSLSGDVNDLTLFKSLNNELWGKIMFTAQKQALLGVCFPSLDLMPADCLPPKEIHLQWAAKTNYIRQENKKKLRVLSDLLLLFESHNIHPIVMKGFSSAISYPQPELRISGDIDLYIPNNYDQSLKVISDLGYEMSATERHHKFYFQDILIELHHDIISPPFKVLIQYSYKEVQYSGVSFRIFDETTTAILLITHAVTHLIGPGLGFRHLCDWALFYKNNSNNIDSTYLNYYIKKNKLIRFVSIFNALSMSLGISDNTSFDNMIAKAITPKDIFALEKDMFEQGDCGKDELLSRKSQNSLYVYGRVLYRFLKSLKYNKIVVYRIIKFRLSGFCK